MKISIKKYGAVLLLLISVTFSNAQVGGISGAKLCVPDAGALPVGSFEFEPSFSVFNSNSRFCEDGAIESLAGESISSSVLFRVTAGIAEGLEIGTAFSSAIEQVSVGSKYIFSESENFSLGLIAGVSLPAGNKFIADTLRDADNNLASSYGALGSIKLSGSSSIDMIFSFTKIHGENSFDKILSYGIGFGQWLSKKFQVVAELNGFSTYNGKLHSGKLSFMPGAQEVVDMSTQVAAASEEQSSAAEQISKNIEGISNVTQESAAGVQQIARASEDLNRLTINLQELVSRFKIGESSSDRSNGNGKLQLEKSNVSVRSNGVLVRH